MSQNKQSTDQKLSDIEQRLKKDTTHRKTLIEQNDRTIRDLRVRLEDCETRRSEMRAQHKLDLQEIKTLKDRINDLEHELLRANHQIDNKLKTIDNRISNVTSKMKTSYASAVKPPTITTMTLREQTGPRLQSPIPVNPVNPPPSHIHNPANNVFPTATNNAPPATNNAPPANDDVIPTNIPNNDGVTHANNAGIHDNGDLNPKPKKKPAMIDLTNTSILWDIYNGNVHGLQFGGDVLPGLPGRQLPRPKKADATDGRPTNKTHNIKSLSKTYSQLEGVARLRTKRVVLYNINANRSFDDVKQQIYDYAHERHVRVTYVRLLKKRTHYDNTETYTAQVNMACDDYEQVSSDDGFWPEDIHCRDYVPRQKNNDRYGQEHRW